MIEIGPYKLIGVNSEADSIPRSIILDTNVAIDIEKFYFGTGRVDREALHQLLTTFPNSNVGRQTVDINYGWAMCEASWTRDGTFKAASMRSLRHSVSQVVNWHLPQIDSAFANRHPPANRDRDWRRGIPLPEREELGHPLSVLLASYASLLYLRKLDSTRSSWRGRGPKWAVRDYIEWMTNIFGTRNAYEVAAGIDLFCGDDARRNSVRNLLKIGGREEPDQLADRTWNAAWDLWFVHLTDGATYGMLPNNAPPEETCVVTRNVDPELVRTASRVVSIIQTGAGSFPFIGSQWDDSSKFDDELFESISMDIAESTRRMTRDPLDMFNQGLDALRDLEAELNIKRSTVDAFLKNNWDN